MLIEKMASLKLNQLQLYTEHTFAFKNHAIVWKGASPYTPEDIKRIQKHCKKHYIDLVPNFNSFGHFERWLKHKNYHHLAICPQGFTSPYGTIMKNGSTLMPDRKTLGFLDELYAEYLPLFSSPYFNAGGDETYELGSGRSEKICQQKGQLVVYQQFLLKLESLIRAHGKKMMFWSDIILKEPSLVHKFPARMTAMIWGYEARHPFARECAIFKSAGLPFYVVPGTSSWNSLIGRLDNCLLNLKSAARNGLKNKADGYLITDWGDGGHHQYAPISDPGLVAGASFSWCYSKNSKLDIEQSLSSTLYRERQDLVPLLLECGRLYKMFNKRFHNSNVFHQLLFHCDKKKVLNGITSKELKSCLERVHRLKARAQKRTRSKNTNEPEWGELENALSMVELGLMRAENELSPQKKHPLSKLLQEITLQHQSLWLHRNRPGGLKESLSYFKSLAN